MDAKPHSTAQSVSTDGYVLSQLVHVLVAALDPDRIILFGSRARDEADLDSDIDLFIQVKIGRDVLAATKDAYRAVRQIGTRPPVGVDIVVKTGPS